MTPHPRRLRRLDILAYGVQAQRDNSPLKKNSGYDLVLNSLTEYVKLRRHVKFLAG